MALNKTQKRLVKELKEVSEICRLDYWNVEDQVPDGAITAALRQHMQKIITAYVIDTYTLVDELLSSEISKVYFKMPKKNVHFGQLWKTKRFRSFAHNILDNLYPLQKMRVLHDIKPIPRAHRDAIGRLNDLRNALAHSFFPQNRKSFYPHKKVVYRGADLFTVNGAELFEEERQELIDYLFARVYGKIDRNQVSSNDDAVS